MTRDEFAMLQRLQLVLWPHDLGTLQLHTLERRFDMADDHRDPA